MRAFLLAMGAFCLGVWSYACAAGDETSTSTSSTNAATSTTSASTTTSASSSSGLGGTAGDGGGGNAMGGNAMGGEGGSGPCVSCSDAFGACVVNNACPPDSGVCSASLATWQAFKTCVCSYCSTDCSATCNNMGTDSTDCGQCWGDSGPTTCNTQLQACVVN